jgi:hypothetical protein
MEAGHMRAAASPKYQRMILAAAFGVAGAGSRPDH